MKKYKFIDAGLTDYYEGIRLQKIYFDAVYNNLMDAVFVMLEHKPVYTIGRANRKEIECYDYLKNVADVYFVDRGGNITFHGPGQLVIYLIVNLEKLDKDVHHYVEILEEIVISILKEYGVRSGRKARYTGVWVNSEKICALGIAIKRWITWHGIAININVDLKYFDCIVPCAIEGFGVTSMMKLGLNVAVSDVIKKIEREIINKLKLGNF